MTVMISESFWDNLYPKSVNQEVDLKAYASVLDVFEKSCQKYPTRPAFSNMGQTLTYEDLRRHARDFASFLQHHTPLKPGDRIAIQMPNLLQYPVCIFGSMMAGLIVVNTNPLYTAREMEHQFNDSGAKALVALANFGHLVETVVPKTQIETVVITEVGDLLNPLKRTLVNGVIKHVKKMVPQYNLPSAVSFVKALYLGKKNQPKSIATPTLSDLAVLQYTGGTTGVSKGAELTHGNLVANMMQIRAMLADFQYGKEVMITPLPLYHIFSFTVNCMAVIETGSHSVLITNPRDISGFVDELKKWKFTAISGLNTLFVALCANPEFRKLDFSHLKITMSGGMALQTAVAQEWEKVTGCRICEGFGLTETSPVVCVNPPEQIHLGTIGLPVPGTQIKVINEQGQELGIGEPGELCVKGPQVMRGYWNKPEATKESISEDGWFRTGDVAVIQEDGYVRIVDRIKDMILVSGFNVYPNELEDVLVAHADVIECAAVGVKDEKSGEAVKMFVVSKNPQLTREEVISYCRERMTAYKVPKYVEFRQELPKSNVGKILRKELRDK